MLIFVINMSLAGGAFRPEKPQAWNPAYRLEALRSQTTDRGPTPVA